VQLLSSEGAVKRLGLVLVAGALSLACGAGFSKQLKAPPGDYELYRRTRVAQPLEARLAAGWRYLSEYPDGQYLAEVREWFARVEPAYYASARDSRRRLAVYLEALPTGPNAKRAAERILELERGRRGARERDARALANARQVQDEIKAAGEARSEFVSTIVEWVRRLSAIDSFGAPTSELDHELIHAYRVAEPSAVCDGLSCSKRVSMSYKVPGSGGLVAREATFSIDLDLVDGSVVAARLVGPELFSRIGEATQRAAIEASDLQARAEGIGQAARVVGRALEGVLPEASCQRDVVSPVVLERACNGVRARMVAAEVEGGDDVVSFEPLNEQADGGPQDASPQR